MNIFLIRCCIILDVRIQAFLIQTETFACHRLNVHCLDHSQKIVDHVVKSMNAAKREHAAKTPTFRGRVAFLGYSLGGIICWDILSNHNKKVPAAQKNLFKLKVPMLEFEVMHLQLAGSPMASCLVMRGQDFLKYRPSCSFSNVFHPFDPIVSLLTNRSLRIIDDALTDVPQLFFFRSGLQNGTIGSSVASKQSPVPCFPGASSAYLESSFPFSVTEHSAPFLSNTSRYPNAAFCHFI
jgi:hypothetical protein